MRRGLVFAMVYVTGAFGMFLPVARGAENQIKNAEFDDGLNSWIRYGTSGYTLNVVQEAGLSGDNALMIDVTNSAGTTSVGTAQSGLKIEPGVIYPIGLTARAEQDREMVILLQGTINGTYPTYLTKTIQLTTQAQTFTLEYTHSGSAIGDDPGEALTLYLMLKGPWWTIEGSDQNKRVWIDRVYFGAVPAPPRRDLATKPSPANGAKDVARDVVLGWTAGTFASTHDVYFGTSAADVGAASRASPLGVLASQDQAEATYDPPGRLEFGRTYFWRVDEVNAPPDSTIAVGKVWSFTVEPSVYVMANIRATASSSEAGKGPENTINSSGLTGDLHSTLDTTMWATRINAATPAWIQYEFDRVYELREMWVWNYNTDIEPFLGTGLKEVTVEYSSNGTDWTPLGDFEFAQAPGQKDYDHGTVVDFKGAAARYVKLTAKSKWGIYLAQYGLSEVRFFYTPAHARQAGPASGQKDVPVDVVLNWRPGRDAALHEVYLSADRAAVANGTALADTVTGSSYDPGSLGLVYGQTYYWKVNEVNEAGDPNVWEGDIWNFTLIGHLVVDDFESYTDDSPNRIFQAWLDGFGYTDPVAVPGNGTGSTVGNTDAPFAERTVVHGGRQAMPMDYNNTFTPYYSEARHTRDTPGDWTGNGGDTLQLFFHGWAARFRESSPGTYLVGSTSGDIWDTADHMRLVYKRLTGDATIVAKIHGVTNTWPWAKAGVMIRETPDAGSAHAMMVVTAEARPAFQNRGATGVVSNSAHGNAGEAVFPHWVKLERKGSQFTAYRSSDGGTWVLQTNNGGGDSPNPRSIAMMQNSVCIGMVVTSNNLSQPCVGEFSDVTITGSVSGDWQIADVGGDNPANTADTLYLAVEDGQGRIATVRHPDPAALLGVDWRSWNVPLSELTAAGVNIGDVVRMYIGAGDRAKPTPGGAGKLYIDDIRVTRQALVDGSN